MQSLKRISLLLPRKYQFRFAFNIKISVKSAVLGINSNSSSSNDVDNLIGFCNNSAFHAMIIEFSFHNEFHLIFLILENRILEQNIQVSFTHSSMIPSILNQFSCRKPIASHCVQFSSGSSIPNPAIQRIIEIFIIPRSHANVYKLRPVYISLHRT